MLMKSCLNKGSDGFRFKVNIPKLGVPRGYYLGPLLLLLLILSLSGLRFPY